MTEALAVYENQQVSRISVPEIMQHAIAVQEVMKAVMKPNIHYGTIPGTDKPTLYKAGAEILCMTFKIADEYQVEELDRGRYRVTCVGRHQITGVTLGSGMGACSTHEEKYKWRKAVCKEEFEATPADQRRTVYKRGKGGGNYTVEQVRTESADLDNTALKMACKRAKMAMVLNVTAASDCFGQDLEDLDETLQEHLTEAARAEAKNFPSITGVRKAVLKTTADEIRALVAKNDDWGAFGLYEPIVDSDEKMYIWPMIPSDCRSALKRCIEAKTALAVDGVTVETGGTPA